MGRLSDERLEFLMNPDGRATIIQPGEIEEMASVLLGYKKDNAWLESMVDELKNLSDAAEQTIVVLKDNLCECPDCQDRANRALAAYDALKGGR